MKRSNRSEALKGFLINNQSINNQFWLHAECILELRESQLNVHSLACSGAFHRIVQSSSGFALRPRCAWMNESSSSTFKPTWMRTPKGSERSEKFECKICWWRLNTVGVELLFCQTDRKEKWKRILNTTRKGNYSKRNTLLPALKSRGGLEWYFTLCISFSLFLSLCGCSLDLFWGGIISGISFFVS